jgi:hypothetical protein
VSQKYTHILIQNMYGQFSVEPKLNVFLYHAKFIKETAQIALIPAVPYGVYYTKQNGGVYLEFRESKKVYKWYCKPENLCHV